MEGDFAARNARYLSGISVWALAFGCVIGWGAFVMPGTTFLPDAGPLGTVLGIAVSALMVLVICYNYLYLAKKYPDAAGSYIYTRNILGEDHAFLAAWALELAYVSLFWANATAFILIGRYLFGDVLEWGFCYRVAGYDVYLGEAAATLGILWLFGLVTCYGKRLADILRTVFAVLLLASVLLLFLGLAAATGGNGLPAPPFSVGEPPAVQVLNIAILAPWLFVGFETVAHSVPETKIAIPRIFAVAALAILAGMAVYIALTLCAAAGAPAGYGGWAPYVADLGNLDGTAGIPVIYNAGALLGDWGIRLVALAAFCALATSVLGFHRAAARILKIMAEGGLLPRRLAVVDGEGVPVRAGLTVLLLSTPIPFIGRTAVSWNADVSTLSVAIVYAYISICTFLGARGQGDGRAKCSGICGMAFAAAVLFCLLVPNVFSQNALAKESYLMLAFWSLAGILYYWHMFRHDREQRFGKSTVMWLMMLFMLFFSVNVWGRLDLQAQIAAALGTGSAAVDAALMAGSLLQLVVIALALAVMFSLFSTMLRREKELDHQIVQAEERNRAKTDFLSNMSHDIRTPMNAIVGFTDLALMDSGNRDKVEAYLGKIKASSAHLLALINDVLEMSRIESGKMALAEEPVNLPQLLHDVEAIIAGQAEAKHQHLSVDASGLADADVLCDRLRLNQVLLNLVSNAVKYTPDGGSISVRILQKAERCEGRSAYEIRVKDTGIGMSPAFAARVFEAFEREQTSTVSGIQGTGLGMAITKRIVDRMGGEIHVDTAPGKGSEFVVAVSFAVAEAAKEEGSAAAAGGVDSPADFRGRRLLLVDDMMINRQIALAMLEMYGFAVEEAADGDEAVAKVSEAAAGYYDAVLMDIQMPRMNGYEAARAIRGLADEKKRAVPIIAMTANAFDEDRKNALAAGMNGHLAKPIDREKLLKLLGETIGKG